MLEAARVIGPEAQSTLGGDMPIVLAPFAAEIAMAVAVAIAIRVTDAVIDGLTD